MTSARITTYIRNATQPVAGVSLGFNLAFSLGLVALSSLPAQAQYQSTTSLRSPLIQGAPSSDPYQAPDSGQPPAIGDGWGPMPVNPGHWGAPELPPTQLDIGMYSPMDKQQIQQQLAPTIPPPPGVPGKDPYLQDPGMISPRPGNGYMPPAYIVNIMPGGGIPENPPAPIVRWGGQTTRDFGMPMVNKKMTSGLTDFGQRIEDMPQTRVRRSTSMDGSRPAVPYPAPKRDSNSLPVTPNRDSNLWGAQTTTDLNGNRRYFKGPSGQMQRALLTEVKY